MDAKESSLEYFRLEVLANTLGQYLRRCSGHRSFYSEQAVSAACNGCGVAQPDWPLAAAMFVKQEEVESALQEFGCAEPAIEIRRQLAQKNFPLYLPNVSYETATNCFHSVGIQQIDPGKVIGFRRRSREHCGGYSACGGGGAGCGHGCGGH